MRASQLRFASASFLFVLIASLVASAQKVAVQPLPGVVQPGGKKEVEKIKDKDLRPEEDWDIPFAPPYERDATKKLQGAREYLSHKEPPWNTIVPLLQNILDAKSDSFFKISDKAGDKLITRRISVKTEANRIISAFPKEGLEFYQQSYGQDAALLLDEAVKNNYDMAMLSDLSQRYFHTRAGAEGTIVLGTLYLERGNYLEAAYAFERLFARPNSEEFLTPRTLFKAALAFKRSGDPRHKALGTGTTDQLQKATARNGLVLGKRTFSFEQLKAEIDRQVTSIRMAYAVGEWNGRYGNAQRNGMVDGGAPFLVPAFKPAEMLLDRRDKDRDANDWIRERLNEQFDPQNKTQMNKAPLPGFFPVTTPDMMIFRSYDGVHAVATRDHTAVIRGEPKLVRAGDTKWISKTNFGIHQLMTLNDTFQDPSVKDSVLQWWSTYKTPNFQATSLLYENPLLGSLAHDSQNVYFIDDVAMPPPPQMNDPNFGFNPGMQVRQSGELSEASRAGELVAVNINSGLQVWTLGRIIANQHSKPPVLPRMTEEEADKSTNAFHLCLNSVFLGPPLPLNGRLYVLIEYEGVVRLLCLDPKNLVAVKDWHLKVPTLVWSQKLGRPNNTLPGDSIRRFQGAFLAAGEGIIICPTNSGMMVGVDIMSRSLLWAHAYRKMDPPAKAVYDPSTGMMRQQGTHLAPDRWRGAAPIVSGGRAILSAYDSPNLDCIDVRSGKLLWSIKRQTEDLYVGGVVNDRVIIVGKTSVRAYNLAGEDDRLNPTPAWFDEKTKDVMKPTMLSGVTPTGHGISSKTTYYLPVRPENAGKDNVPAAEIWAINLETGAVTSKTGARARKDSNSNDLARFGLGNLVFQDGLVIAQSAFEVAVYPQLEVKKAEMDRLLKLNPKDPRGLFNRGEIHLDDGKIMEAIADFKEAEKNNPPEELKPGIKDKLYVAFTEILREKFSAGEVFLKEYEELCSVPLGTDLEPFELRRREDESLRRKRLYYYLLAKGREEQKRLSEAFDHYLKLASLGEGKTLFEMPDEPSVRMRPDVWARGRIEGMIRRAGDPVARKSLEDRVNQEWIDVQAKNDRKKLQEFVDVFGPYFPAGSAAQLKLADVLIESGTDDDNRDAQVHLSMLRATADDPAVRAKATETLARMMVKNQLMEDAVGLYLQLGKEYPTVVIRDGKTGADFLTDLLTDRRLLPFLEPARYPLPPKVKAEAILGQNNVNMGASFEVEPEGELFPMYRRLRFTIDMVTSGNQTWTLRGYDRSTGMERCRFGDIHPPMQYNPGNWQSAKYIQASGHLMLVQVGNWMYCFDLAEKKERWRKNLLGDNINVQANQIIDNGNGDVYVQYIDGTRQQVGKIAAIQPGYVCLLTRDGLEVVEPTSRKQLWNRRNVGDKLQIYGDARFIMVVEVGADFRPIGTRLLRAVDGMTVEGSPESGKILGAAKSYKIFGRHVLLQEADGEKQVLRLYDAATGKDVWKKEYDSKAIPVRALNTEWTGFMKSTGEVEILDTMTGKSVGGGFKLDPKLGEAHLKGCTEVQLFADTDRFYMVLDRTPGGPAGINRRNMMIYGYSMRTHLVNGPMYAFDRTSGKRLWFVEDVLDNQWLVLERFADLPVIIAAAPIANPNGQQTYKIVVIEKDQGAIRLNKGILNNGNYFQNMTVDLKNGEINLHRYDMRIKISPADPQVK